MGSMKDIVYKYLDGVATINDNIIKFKGATPPNIFDIFGTETISIHDWAMDRIGEIYCIRLDYTEYWYKNGSIHRDNGLPAIIDYDVDGGRYSESWYQNGWMYRDDDKPVIVYYKDHRIIELEIQLGSLIVDEE